MIDTLVVVPIRIHSTVGRSQVWVIHSRELGPVLVAILRIHLWEKHYPHRYYEHEVQGFGNGFQNQESLYYKGGRHHGICSPNFVNSKLDSKLFQCHTLKKSYHVTLLQNLTIIYGCKNWPPIMNDYKFYYENFTCPVHGHGLLVVEYDGPKLCLVYQKQTISSDLFFFYQ